MSGRRAGERRQLEQNRCGRWSPPSCWWSRRLQRLDEEMVAAAVGVTCQAPLSPTATFSICSSAPNCDVDLIAGRGLELDDLVGIIVDGLDARIAGARRAAGSAPPPAGGAQRERDEDRPPHSSALRRRAAACWRRLGGLAAPGAAGTVTGPTTGWTRLRRRLGRRQRLGVAAVAQHLEAERIDQPVLDPHRLAGIAIADHRHPGSGRLRPGRRGRAAASRSGPWRRWGRATRCSSPASRPPWSADSGRAGFRDWRPAGRSHRWTAPRPPTRARPGDSRSAACRCRSSRAR